ncbi:hypothetical protein ANN_08570 [Periplaneta americana]|uniref:Uncharacterized protein n=1 Tax=Periplaneta americana TaxID=6978 RepID=A0ABQ8T1S5_PERAM|nr:hypothetical protein ANN_08570 [Periplaneta americana]
MLFSSRSLLSCSIRNYSYLLKQDVMFDTWSWGSECSRQPSLPVVSIQTGLLDRVICECRRRDGPHVPSLGTRLAEESVEGLNPSLNVTTVSLGLEGRGGMVRDVCVGSGKSVKWVIKEATKLYTMIVNKVYTSIVLRLQNVDKHSHGKRKKRRKGGDLNILDLSVLQPPVAQDVTKRHVKTLEKNSSHLKEGNTKMLHLNSDCKWQECSTMPYSITRSL